MHYLWGIVRHINVTFVHFQKQQLRNKTKQYKTKGILQLLEMAEKVRLCSMKSVEGQYYNW